MEWSLRIHGTIRFYGTPAEEKFFGKLWMIRAGLFDDVDVVMDWHPSAETRADVQSSLALVDFMVEFHGQAAHAAGDPWNGRSASDALELYTTGINFYREHVKPTVRIHYHIQATGKEQVGIESIIEPLEETKENPGGGSTDVGDVSWVVPTVRLRATTAPKGTPWHSWAVVACGGMSIGHKGMAYASKALAMTMVDLFEDADLRKAVKEEFKERKGDYEYKGMIPDGPPPIDYRD